MPAARDPFGGGAGNFDSPIYNAVAVTPSDTVDLAVVSRALYVGGAGNVCVNMGTTGTAVVFSNVSAGAILPIAASRVKSTSTTATGIVSLY